MTAEISYNGTVADATLTASSKADSYEKEFVYDDSQANKWRTTSITTESLLIDHGAAKTIKTVFIDGSNIESGDTTFTIQAGTTVAATDWGPTALTKDTKSYLELNQTYRYFLMKVTKASGSYTEFGKFELYQDRDAFTKNNQIDREMGSEKVFEIRRGRAGQIYRKFLYRANIRRWTFLNILQAQADLFDQTYGELEDCVLWDDQLQEAFYGIIDISTLTTNRCENYNCTLSFREKR
jgi:hypothetical protein